MDKPNYDQMAEELSKVLVDGGFVMMFGINNKEINESFKKYFHINEVNFKWVA